MDNLRVFTTFKPTSNSYDSSVKKKSKKAIPLGPDGMITRTSEDKPFKSRSEILDKLEKNQVGIQNTGPKVIKGQKFGMDFMDDDGVSAPSGDLATNDPKDPMTTEKLKSMLHSGAVNFSGKEQEVLAKILGN